MHMSSKDKKIAKNSIYLLSRTLLLTVISLYTMREILHVLGVEDYGLFNLIYGIVALFTFANGALTASTQRFLSYKIGENDNQGVKNVFYSSVEIHLLLASIIILISFLFKDYILNELLNIKNMQYEANIIYNLALFSVFISIFQSPFTALITSYEKMEIFAYISLLEAGAKLCVVYLLYVFSGEKIILYSSYLLIISVFIFIIYSFFCIKKIPNIFKEINKVDMRKYRKEILNFMGWSLIGNLAWISRIQGVNVILNIFYGVSVNAVYAISINVSNVINSFFLSVSNAIKPQIFKSYAQGDINRFHKLISKGTKYNLIGLLIFVIPLIILINETLFFWLKEVPSNAAIFIELSLVILFFEISSSFLITGIQATGKISLYQFILGGLILLNLPIIYVLLYWGASVESSFYVLIFISAISLIARLIFIYKYTGYNLKLYFNEVVVPIVFSILIIYCFDYILYNSLMKYYYIEFTEFLNLFFMAFILIVVNILISLIFALDKAEKNIVFSYIKKLF